MEKLVRNQGITVLKNRLVNVAGIQLPGLNYMRANDTILDIHAHAEKSSSTIQQELLKIHPDDSLPTVIAHHSPNGIEYMNRLGVDLVLSSHTHAGQLFPVSLITRLKFFYLQGLYNYKNTKIYITQSAGTFGPPMRLDTKSTIDLIHLVNAEADMNSTP